MFYVRASIVLVISDKGTIFFAVYFSITSFGIPNTTHDALFCAIVCTPFWHIFNSLFIGYKIIPVADLIRNANLMGHA